VTEQEIHTGQVMDELATLTLQELCHACRVEQAWLLQLVDEGILEPRGRERSSWRFAGSSLRRVLVVSRLQNDLGINLQGAAMVLDLMQEIETLRARLTRFNY